MPLSFYLGLSIVLFVLGALGVLLRHNAIVIFMSLELMFNAANLAFISFSAYHHIVTGQLFVFFVMAVAASEVAIGLALIVVVFRTKRTINIDQLNTLKG
jgi:NADH-quinone oxidoreductase subunit K